ncbi:MAG: fibronectin type III domain-containing protein [Microbacterium gubbeenense]
MLTTDSTPHPSGAGHRRSPGRRTVAGAVLLSLTAGSFALTALPASAEEGPTASSDASTAAKPVRVEGESYTGDNNGTEINGRVIDTGVETSPGASGGSRVKNTYDGAELTYDNVDLGSAPLSTLTVRYVVNEGRSGVNASVDIYLDEKTDENKVATAELAPTGNDWEAYGETTVDLLREVSGEHTVILVMHTDPKPGEDEGYPNYVGNIDYLEFGLAPLPETYLTSETPWNYSDNGTDPSGDGSLSWTTAEAGDWQQAAGPFGSKRGEADLGGGFVATTLLQYTLDGSENTVPTYHFRTDVAISEDDLARLEALQGTITYDDAVRVYVNGEKVAGFADDRVNDAENQNLTYAGESAGDPVSRTFEIPADALVAGDNQIAVALYQDRESSSDIFFDWTSLAPVEEGVVVPTEITDLLLGVGETEEQRNLSWYSNTDVPQAAQLAKAADVVDGAFPETAATFETTAGGETTSGEYFRDTTLTGLEENTEYSYRVGSDENGWSEVETFRTQAFDGDFDFLLFGDPQVGASGNLANDEAGWVSTMNTATQTYPGAELLFSAGDQVNTASSEAEYASFLKPSQMREIPLAPTNGNHDVGSKAYEQHYNLPNEDLESGAAGSSSASGGDYWFIYKDVLFLNINSNSRDYDSHNAFMEKVVAEQGDKVKWTVLGFHHSIYSAASHATDGDIIDRRNSMPQKISELGIDMVLMGHDHHYTRSFLINNGEIADPDEQAAEEEVVAGPGDVLYVTANSASGSKYYNLNTGTDLWWSSVRNQEKVRNYSAVEVTDETITVRTLRSQANGATSPINSVVDEVVLRKAADEQQLDVSVDAKTRTLAGKQYVSVSTTNNADVPVDIVVETEFGSKSFTAVQPGAAANVSVNSRQGSIPAGEVTVTITGQVGEEQVTTSKTAEYAAAG